MSNRTPVYILCSPRPRSGKTFLARLLLDFMRFDGKAAVVAFDVNPHEPVLSEFLPRVTRVIDITNTQHQMMLFDLMVRDDGVPKVIDLGATSYETFFDVAGDIGFFEESRTAGIDRILLFPVDAHPNAAKAYADLGQRLDNIMLIPVYNDAIAEGHLYRSRFPPMHPATIPLHVMALRPGLKPYADNPNHSFADLYEAPPEEMPPGLAAELRDWTMRTFREFRELELRLLLRKLQSSLRKTG
jgi:hypothetical protein